MDELQPALEVRDLTKVYGRHVAVDHLTFSVPRGEVTGFLGPNGAGKSTTLRMILGLVHPTSGTSTVAGHRYRDLPDRARTIGALLDTEQFHPGRTGRNHLRTLTAAAGLPDDRVDHVLDLVEMGGAADRRTGTYSLGMRQRLGIAAALLGDPQVLVLDEPANGLDPSGMRWLRTFLRRFAAEDRAVFVSSHQLSEVAQMADSVVVLSGGRLVAHQSVQELTTDERSLEEVFLELTGQQGAGR